MRLYRKRLEITIQGCKRQLDIRSKRLQAYVKTRNQISGHINYTDAFKTGWAAQVDELVNHELTKIEQLNLALAGAQRKLQELQS